MISLEGMRDTWIVASNASLLLLFGSITGILLPGRCMLHIAHGSEETSSVLMGVFPWTRFSKLLSVS